ncbi:hypothetical protein AB3S75_033565 [Citrus x aurantiifolia]
MLSWLDLLLFRMLSSKDINFVGYTYKKFEIVNEHHLPGIEDESATVNQPVRGWSFLNLLPTLIEVPEEEGISFQ